MISLVHQNVSVRRQVADKRFQAAPRRYARRRIIWITDVDQPAIFAYRFRHLHQLMSIRCSQWDLDYLSVCGLGIEFNRLKCGRGHHQLFARPGKCAGSHLEDLCRSAAQRYLIGFYVVHGGNAFDQLVITAVRIAVGVLKWVLHG